MLAVCPSEGEIKTKQNKSSSDVRIVRAFRRRTCLFTGSIKLMRERISTL